MDLGVQIGGLALDIAWRAKLRESRNMWAPNPGSVYGGQKHSLLPWVSVK